MSAILGSSVTGAGAVAAYTIDNSLRLRRSASASLSRPATTASNRKTWSWSGWVKPGMITTSIFPFFAVDNGSSSQNSVNFIGFSNNKIILSDSQEYSTQYDLQTTAVYRDPSSWYHIVVAVDTTQATASNRIKLYVNGSQVTSFSTATYPTQNLDTFVNTGSGSTQRIGAQFDLTSFQYNYFDGCLAEVNFINGQALTPSSFGETNASTGVWQPKAYSGSYGTNGFYLKFSDIATTSGSNAGLGKDFSGNGNFFNTNNISVTPGATYDAMTDSPTPKSNTVGNYAVLNPLWFSNSNIGTFSNGNLNLVGSGTWSNAVSTIGVSSGKWYFEMTALTGASTDGIMIGLLRNQMPASGNFIGSDANNYGYYSFNGQKVTGGSFSSYGASYNNNDIIGCAFDADNGTLTFYKNGVSQGVAFSGISVSGNTWYLGISCYAPSSALVNFGQHPFAYTPPSGFNRLQTFNLPTPTIGASETTLANKYFDAAVYAGNNSVQTITNGGFQPDAVWIKCRTSANDNVLYASQTDTYLVTNSTAAETSAGFAINPTSNGFTLTTNSTILNASPLNYVAWQWNAGGNTVTNTSGTISSQVRANTTCGFSVINYNGNSTSNASVGHGLGAVAKVVILKNRTDGSANSPWPVYTNAIDGSSDFLYLDRTSAKADSSTTAANSSVFYISGSTATGGSGFSYVAYAFAEIPGFSKIATYTGNGSGNGPFIYTGFRPEYIMIKATSTTGDWIVLDDARNPENVVTRILYPNLSNGEATSPGYADFCSNGFKLRNTAGAVNGSGTTYLYMAFAKTPFNYSLAR